SYGDQTFPGTIRTQDASGWVNAAGLGVDDVAQWTLSTLGDAEGSLAGSNGNPASPGRSTRATVPYDPCANGGVPRITEYMYSGTDGEFIEFSNTGNAPLNVVGWSYSDSARLVGDVDLSAYAIIQPGESVILTESSASDFRQAWGLCEGTKVIGGLSSNLGRSDEINLYDAQGNAIDQLTYGDQSFPGTIRTQDAAGWVSAVGLGQNQISEWTLASLADAEGSIASTGGDLGSPGRSSRVQTAFDPCVGVPGGPQLSLNQSAAAPFVDLGTNGGGALSGVIADPTDPAASQGLFFDLADDGGAENLVVDVISTNPQVVSSQFLLLSGEGASRRLRIFPIGVGYSVIIVSATDLDGKVGTYVIQYAASAPSIEASLTRFRTGAADASAAISLAGNQVVVADDENQALRIYERDRSGWPQASFDFTDQLGLTDLSGGVPREVDIEAATAIGSRIYWSGSQGNARDGDERPNTRRLFATDVSGRGTGTTLSYVGRYDHLRDDLVAWDVANGHGMGADFFGFAAGTQPSVPPIIATGFNIEALSIAPDGSSGWLGFRAPLIGGQALIVPLGNLDALVATPLEGSQGPGSAQFGTPILLDLGGRAIRSLERNAAGEYLIIAGPVGAEGPAPNDFRLYRWSGDPLDAPVALNLNLADRLSGGSYEAIVEVPPDLLAGGPLELIVDTGDHVYYNDGVAAKDLAEQRFAKFRSELFQLPGDALLVDGFEGD
ncbi:MAG: DUF3616 domain-containing protein, partial [Xanthomonadales bacterium]|nr:DUF3616 domain-containing protein [Xanthomonadales bacterium]